MKPTRLAVFTPRIIQYKSPLYKYLASQPGLELTVYYYSQAGLNVQENLRQGRDIHWDTPVLDGYQYEFLPNWIDDYRSKSSSIGPYFNPALIRRLFSSHYDVVMIHSYLYPSDWLAWAFSKLTGTAVLFYGEVMPAIQRTRSRRALRAVFHRTMIQGSDACLAVSSAGRKCSG